eukprot:TRINITY_DN1386_c1_g1_i2.p1 TRINITY_DN1386_c1_g1~~TRINITY_DN1386_c1_g1_i2.p1  ORF type:complete len:245 (-),score=23.83 TRINITY_DN1386_c1_g1_i2:418-1098(-)
MSDINSITGDISALKQCNAHLERALIRVGTAQDDSSYRQTMEAEREQAKTLIKTIMANLRNCTESKQERAQLAGDFEQSVKQFVSISQTIESKQKKVVTYSESVQDRNTSPIATADMQMDDMQMDIRIDLDEIKHRQSAIQQIERDVSEISEMFKDLAVLVNDQGAVLDHIENNIQSSKANVEKGHENLVSAEEYQNKARKRTCCLIMLLLVVAGVIVLPIVLTKN